MKGLDEPSLTGAVATHSRGIERQKGCFSQPGCIVCYIGISVGQSIVKLGW